jgi:hypothetical protein
VPVDWQRARCEVLEYQVAVCKALHSAYLCFSSNIHTITYGSRLAGVEAGS